MKNFIILCIMSGSSICFANTAIQTCFESDSAAGKGLASTLHLESIGHYSDGDKDWVQVSLEYERQFL